MAAYLLHALVSGAVILLIILALRSAGVTTERGKWSWPTFAAIFVVMFLLNIVWPWPS